MPTCQIAENIKAETSKYHGWQDSMPTMEALGIIEQHFYVEVTFYAACAWNDRLCDIR